MVVSRGKVWLRAWPCATLIRRVARQIFLRLPVCSTPHDPCEAESSEYPIKLITLSEDEMEQLSQAGAIRNPAACAAGF